MGMTLVLFWLTISTPFVYASQQFRASFEQSNPVSTSDENSSAPTGTMTEEKTAGSTSLSEEYLLDAHSTANLNCLSSAPHIPYDAREYTAFHGEMPEPPPNLHS